MDFDAGRESFSSVSSLCLEGLKKVVREWLKSGKTMNSLLWECYDEQLEGYSAAPTLDNYIQFSNSEVLPLRARRILAAAESYGHSEVSAMFCSNLKDGSNRYEPYIEMGPLNFTEVRQYFENLVCMVEKHDSRNQGFACIVDVAKFIQDNMQNTSGVKVIMRKNSGYELFVRVYKSKERWQELDRLLCPMGMSSCRSKDVPIAIWQFKAPSSKEFYKLISKFTNANRTS